MQIVKTEKEETRNFNLGVGALVAIFWLAVSVVMVYFIARAVYSSWVDTYETNLMVTLPEVCDQHGGYDYWSQTEPEDPEESPVPVFKCILR